MAVWQIFIIFAAIMEKIKDINDSGVLISQDAIENSLHKKAQRKLTLAQLPVYRAVGNLKFVIIGIAKNAPRNLRRFTDSLYEEADNLATSIGSADVSFSVEDRRWYIGQAIVFVNNLRQDFVLLEKNHLISKDLLKKAQSHVKGIQNQLMAWRGSLPASEGSVLLPTPKGGEA